MRRIATRFLGKLRGARLRLGSGFRVMGARWSEGVSLSGNAWLGRGSTLEACDGGRINIGRNFSLGAHARIIARRGGVVTIGDNVSIGDGAFVVALGAVTIGADTLIAEYVVIRDQDHKHTTRPVRSAGFNVASVSIGRDVWIGAKSSILKGSSISDGAVIGAHTLVRGQIPAFTLAVGAPVRIVRSIARTV